MTAPGDGIHSSLATLLFTMLFSSWRQSCSSSRKEVPHVNKRAVQYGRCAPRNVVVEHRKIIQRQRPKYLNIRSAWAGSPFKAEMLTKINSAPTTSSHVPSYPYRSRSWVLHKFIEQPRDSRKVDRRMNRSYWTTEVRKTTLR